MKSLIKSGVLLALGWLANHANAQTVQWQSAAPSGGAVAASSQSSNQASPTGVRPVGLSRPTPLNPGQDVAPAAFQRVVRGQAPDEITIQALPKVETGKPVQVPKVMPKDNGFVPPYPAPAISGPVYEGMPFADGCGPDIGSEPRSIWGNYLVSDGCCPNRGRTWASAEYLMWWQRSQQVPPLITTAQPGTSFASGAASLALSSTTVLYDQTPNRTRGGGRFVLGAWLPHFGDSLGFEAGFFFIGRQAASSTFTSNGTTILGRPFTDQNGVQRAEVFSFPNLASGTATVATTSQIWGLEGNLRYKWLCGSGYWVDLLAGYRHISLSEGIDISEDVTFGPGTQSPGLRSIEQESFQTRNQFNGGQLGIDSQFRIGNRCSLGLWSKVAFGNMYQIVSIDGSTTFSNAPAPGVNGTQTGALLASTTNIGRYTQNHFAVVPEIGVNLGYDVTDNLRLFVGYSFLYMSNVVRPGNQIDLNVNQTFRPSPFPRATPSGAQVPAVLFRTSDYWAQGLTFGMQLRW